MVVSATVLVIPFSRFVEIRSSLCCCFLLPICRQDFPIPFLFGLFALCVCCYCLFFSNFWTPVFPQPKKQWTILLLLSYFHLATVPATSSSPTSKGKLSGADVLAAAAAAMASQEKEGEAAAAAASGVARTGTGTGTAKSTTTSTQLTSTSTTAAMTAPKSKTTTIQPTTTTSNSKITDATTSSAATSLASFKLANPAMETTTTSSSSVAGASVAAGVVVGEKRPPPVQKKRPYRRTKRPKNYCDKSTVTTTTDAVNTPINVYDAVLGEADGKKKENIGFVLFLSFRTVLVFPVGTCHCHRPDFFGFLTKHTCRAYSHEVVGLIEFVSSFVFLLNTFFLFTNLLHHKIYYVPQWKHNLWDD